MNLFFFPVNNSKLHLLSALYCIPYSISLTMSGQMCAFKIHNHDLCDVDSSEGPTYATGRVALLLQKFMSPFARPQAAAQDHEHQVRRAKVSTVKTRKCSSCLKLGHDRRTCPKLVASGTERGANESDAVRESHFWHLNNNLRLPKMLCHFYT